MGKGMLWSRVRSRTVRHSDRSNFGSPGVRQRVQCRAVRHSDRPDFRSKCVHGRMCCGTLRHSDRSNFRSEGVQRFILSANSSTNIITSSDFVVTNLGAYSEQRDVL